MKIMQPYVEYINRDDHPYHIIEQVGRLCYKSENLATSTSANKFVQMLAKNNHLAMLEHGHIYMRLSDQDMRQLWAVVRQLRLSEVNASECCCNFITMTSNYVSGSLRTFIELTQSSLHEVPIIRRIQQALADAYPLVFPYISSPKVSADTIIIFANQASLLKMSSV